MNKKSYYISKTRTKKEVIDLEYEKMKGYSVKPKVHDEDAILVNKIVFVDPEFSEKIIRKKIDRRIDKLLDQLKKIDEDNDGDVGVIQKTLMDSEKLRLQIINNYVKYLGHTYESLTLEKIAVIANELKYKLFMLELKKQSRDTQKEGRRGR